MVRSFIRSKWHNPLRFLSLTFLLQENSPEMEKAYLYDIPNLHLGKKLHTETAKNIQKEIDELLGRNYADSDKSRPTDGEVYIRLEWVDKLDQIIPFIDKAYEMRLQK